MDTGLAKKLVADLNRQTGDNIKRDIEISVRKSGCTNIEDGNAMYSTVISDLSRTRKLEGFSDTVDIKSSVKIVRSPYEYRLNKSVGQLSATIELKKDSQFIEDIAIALTISPGLSKGGKLWQYYNFFPHKLIKRVRITDSTGKIDIADYTGEAYNVYYAHIIDSNKAETYRECMNQSTSWNSEYKVGQNISTQKTFIYGAQSLSDNHQEKVVHIPLLFKSTRHVDVNKYGDKLSITIDIEPQIESIIFPTMQASDFQVRPQISDQCSVIVTQFMIDPNLYRLIKFPVNSVNNKKLNSFYRCYHYTATSGNSISLKQVVGEKNYIVKLFVGLRPKANAFDPRVWNSNELYNDMFVRDTVFDNTTNTFVLVGRTEKVRNTSRWVKAVTVRNGESEYFDADLKPEFFKSYITSLGPIISANDSTSGWYAFPFNNEPSAIDGMLPMTTDNDYKLYIELDETIVIPNNIDLFLVVECCNLVDSNYR